ncbi:hypothetical protein SUGI_0732710 [Cryptomeria japonica]|nr:hypothetical protein SUGI_0732710 [Cryptomeria japonica]
MDLPDVFNYDKSIGARYNVMSNGGPKKSIFPQPREMEEGRFVVSFALLIPSSANIYEIDSHWVDICSQSISSCLME